TSHSPLPLHAPLPIFELAYDRVGPAASRSTSACASSISRSSGWTQLTRPHSSACCAGTRSPSSAIWNARAFPTAGGTNAVDPPRSEEHTSELQSRQHL